MAKITASINGEGIKVGHYPTINITTDTGGTGSGDDGKTYIPNPTTGTFFLDGEDTGIKAIGDDGESLTFEDLTEAQKLELRGKSTFEKVLEKGYQGTESEFIAKMVVLLNGDAVQEDSTYDDAVANGYEGTPEEFWQDILILISNQDVVTPPTDTTAPVITLIGADTLNLTVGDSYTELGATTDDGSLVVIDSTNVNTSTESSYVVTYNATDNAGNVAIQVTRTVIVESEVVTQPTENTDDDIVIGFGLTTSDIPNNFRETHVGTTDNALFTNLGADSGVVLAFSTSNGLIGRQTSGGRLYGVADYDGTLKNDVVSKSVVFPNSGETITLSLSGTGITPNTNRTFRIISSRVTSTSRPNQVTANGVVVGTYNASVDPIGEPLEFTVNTGESGNVDILIEGIDGNGFAYLNGLTLKA